MAERLATLQARFFDLATRRATASAPIGGLFAGADADDHAFRIAIYADAYAARLVGALREDFPCVASLVGAEAFARLGRAYMDRHPSTRPSLRDFGASFPRFLANEESAQWPWLADLAALEWARVEVFDAATSEPASFDELAGVNVERWPSVAFEAAPWMRLVEANWPVNDAWRALDAGANVPALSPGATCIVVWRRDFVPVHRAASALECEALKLALGRAPFARICEAYVGVANGPARALEHLRTWFADGLFVAVHS